MTDTKNPSNELKEKILTDPNIILENTELMDALINAQNNLRGNNIVDLRGAAMKQLEITSKKGGEWAFKAKQKLDTDYVY